MPLCSNLCHCVQPENLIVEITGALQKKATFYSKNVFWENAVGYSQKWWAFKLFSRNERKPLSKLKHVLRKCSGVSQKQWMLELSNLCHCVQHPWKLTGRDFWSSRNERKPLSKLQHVFEKMLWGISEMVNARAFKPFHCVQHPWKLTARDFWSSRNERKPLSAKMFSEHAVEYLRNSEC